MPERRRSSGRAASPLPSAAGVASARNLPSSACTSGLISSLQPARATRLRPRRTSRAASSTACSGPDSRWVTAALVPRASAASATCAAGALATLSENSAGEAASGPCTTMSRTSDSA